MNTTKLIIAGFGGQGILYIGQLLSYAANDKGKNVSWLPSYGPEMRGGTANCMVCISDGDVNSPMVLDPHILIAMNKPSMVRFEDSLRPGGLIIVNEDLVDIESKRDDVTVVKVAADTIAVSLDNPKAANMVALGALIGATGIIEIEDAKVSLEKMMTGPKAKFIPANLEAIRLGYEAARQAQKGELR